ncbi:hypothetical protein ACFE04_000608 [Oxalis oulophora]
MASNSHSRNTQMECLNLFDDQPKCLTGSLLCYCDVPAIMLSSIEINNNKRTLVTCSKHNEVKKCNMWEWFYNETTEPHCKKLLEMRRDVYKLSLNHGPIALSAFKGRLYNGYPLCFCNQFCKISTIREGPHARRRFFACTYYDDDTCVGICKLKVWFYPSTKIEEVSTFKMNNFTTWEEEKRAHKRARSWIHYLENQNRNLVRENQQLKLYVPSPTPLQMHVRRGRPTFKKMIATRSTWTDKNWTADENVILERVPKITNLGL